MLLINKHMDFLMKMIRSNLWCSDIKIIDEENNRSYSFGLVSFKIKTKIKFMLEKYNTSYQDKKKKKQ